MVARKTNKPPTRIWSFHAEPPVQKDLARDLLWKAHHYYNKLIEIERERVREYRETREFYAPHLVELRKAVENALATPRKTYHNGIAEPQMLRPLVVLPALICRRDHNGIGASNAATNRNRP